MPTRLHEATGGAMPSRHPARRPEPVGARSASGAWVMTLETLFEFGRAETGQLLKAVGVARGERPRTQQVHAEYSPDAARPRGHHDHAVRQQDGLADGVGD